MNRIFSLIIVISGIILISMTNDPGQTPGEKYANGDSVPAKSQNVSVVFWNVENLYDPYDDSTTLDNEYTAGGSRHWNYKKFQTKLHHLAKSLLAAGEWIPPVIAGFCEIENRYVLNKLIYDSPLKHCRYRIVHHESPDYRGIDVAVIYRQDLVKPIISKAERIIFPFDPAARTRDILMVKFQIFPHDTLILFVNHWPSRRGGQLESQPRRDFVAKRLRKLIDSIQSSEPKSNILVMGDFNDEPESSSTSVILKARLDTVNLQSTDLINLMAPKVNREGTHKFRGNWAILDQFMVSGMLFLGMNGLKSGFNEASIFKSSFLLKNDDQYYGAKPMRSFNGFRYEAGFSDHLPIHLEIKRVRK